MHFHHFSSPENNDDAMNCPDDELMAVLNYSLVIATYPTISDSSMATDVELVRPTDYYYPCI